MARSIEEYLDRWTNPHSPIGIGHPLDMQMTPESCIIDEVISDSIGSGSVSVADFGDAICFFLYFRMSDDLDTKTPPSGKQLAGHAAARTALTALLERYCSIGYDPSMKTALMQAVNGNLRNFSIDHVYVLPDDLPTVLDMYGDEDEDADASEGEGDVVVRAPLFDITNPEHQEALLWRIQQTAM